LKRKRGFVEISPVALKINKRLEEEEDLKRKRLC